MTETTKCYQEIEKLILHGKLLPGKKLTIAKLSQILNYGQNPIREALSRLSHSGFVEIIDNKGFKVGSISIENAQDIYHTFLNIEKLALKESIQYGNDEWKSNIVGSLYNLSLLESNSTQSICFEAWEKRNFEFHYALISACKSKLLLEIRNDLYKKFQRYCFLNFTLLNEKLDLNHKEHILLANHVIEKNELIAIQILERHILSPLDAVIKSLFTKKKFENLYEKTTVII